MERPPRVDWTANVWDPSSASPEREGRIVGLHHSGKRYKLRAAIKVLEFSAYLAQSSPKKTQQTIAPTTLIESPQASNLLKSDFRFSEGGAFAMQSAPSVERGDASTKNAPTLMEDAIAMGSPPPSFWIRPGMVGRKAGITTPEELL